MTFNGQQIWGQTQLHERGPIGQGGPLRRVIPGVSGFRVYKTRKHSVLWICSGRLLGTSRSNLESQILIGTNYQLDGGLYTFVSKSGSNYTNCLLESFEPVEQVRYVRIGAVDFVTVRVAGRVVWAAPT